MWTRGVTTPLFSITTTGEGVDIEHWEGEITSTSH